MRCQDTTSIDELGPKTTHPFTPTENVVDRWANLPPELRAIKERWLGSSGEEISCSLPENGVMWSFPGSEGEEVGSRCGKKV